MLLYGFTSPVRSPSKSWAGYASGWVEGCFHRSVRIYASVTYLERGWSTELSFAPAALVQPLSMSLPGEVPDAWGLLTRLSTALRSLRHHKHILPLPTCSTVSLLSAGKHCSEPTRLSGDKYGVWECELQQNEQSNSFPMSVEESNFPGKFLQ